MAKLQIGRKAVRVILLVLLVFIFIPAVGVAAYRGINYLQAKSLVSEANSLVGVEKYDQAIEKYALAQAKWSPKSLKEEEDRNLLNAQKLKEEKDNFDSGINYYNNKEWENAKELLLKIPSESKYFQEAASKLGSIEAELETEQQAKIKADQEAKQKAQVKGVSTTAVQPQATSNANKDSLCRNQAEMFKLQQQDKYMDQLRTDAPFLFYTDGQLESIYGYGWEGVKQNYQNQYNQFMAKFNSALEQAYLMEYNDCLNK